MNISNIIYYTRNEKKNETLSLKDLRLKEKFVQNIDTIFEAIQEATDTAELLRLFEQMCCDQIVLRKENSSYISFDVIDDYGRKNFLKLKKKK